jgi:hypothetical protein
MEFNKTKLYTVYYIGTCLNTERSESCPVPIRVDFKILTRYGINKIPVMRIRKYFFWIRIRNSNVRILTCKDPDPYNFLPGLLLLLMSLMLQVFPTFLASLLLFAYQLPGVPAVTLLASLVLLTNLMLTFFPTFLFCYWCFKCLTSL